MRRSLLQAYPAIRGINGNLGKEDPVAAEKPRLSAVELACLPSGQTQPATF